MVVYVMLELLTIRTGSRRTDDDWNRELSIRDQFVSSERRAPEIDEVATTRSEIRKDRKSSELATA